MSLSPISTSNEQSLYAALELSKNSWLLAIQLPGRDNPSLHPIKGGDAEGLVAKLDAARDRLAKMTGRRPRVTLCYEAGYDGFAIWRRGGGSPIQPIEMCSTRLAQAPSDAITRKFDVVAKAHPDCRR